MIYLIDDKKLRQELDFGWTEIKIKNYENVIIAIHSIENLIEKAEDILKENNTVLYHESFLDNSIYAKQALEKRNHLEEFASNNPRFNLVFFSGSKFNRSLDNNIAHLPVSILYLNLEEFIIQTIKGRKNLNILLFGKNPRIESELNERLNKALTVIESAPAKIPNQNNLFLRTVKGNIQNPIENCKEKTLFNSDVSDTKFSEYIDEWLDDVKYDNIFVPLCFGATLSDFNGLRFASHIRCTDTINRTSNIFIYGYVGIEYLLNHECFNILKTKNVKLIGFQKSEFEKNGNEYKEGLTYEDLSIEVKKLKLNVPKDFGDNHSINNEWAIYRWIWTLPATFYDKAEEVLNNVENRLYFKYLKTIYPVGYDTISEDDLKIKRDDGKVLLIDNDYKKGWKVLFNYIINTCNNLQFDTLEIDYKALTRDEVVENAYNKVIDRETNQINYDVVILDFRLHPSDNNEKVIDFISGIQVLKKLKEFNSGIQVIMFSATNKVWNLQALQKLGADGFIHKESFENSSNNDSTVETVKNMIKSLNVSLKRGFLKEIYIKCKNIRLQVLACEYVDDTPFEYFLNDLKKHLKIIEMSIGNIELDNSMTLDIVFLNCYNFLEKFKNYYLREVGYQIVLGEEEVQMKRYSMKKNKISSFIDEGPFIRNNKYDNPSWFNVQVGLYLDYFQLNKQMNTFIAKFYKVKEARNSYIHKGKKSFTKEELFEVFDLCLVMTSSMRE